MKKVIFYQTAPLNTFDRKKYLIGYEHVEELLNVVYDEFEIIKAPRGGHGEVKAMISGCPTWLSKRPEVRYLYCTSLDGDKHCMKDGVSEITHCDGSVSIKNINDLTNYVF